MFLLLCQDEQLQLQSLAGSTDWLIVMCSLPADAPELCFYSCNLVPASCSKECDPFKRWVVVFPVLLSDQKMTSCPNFPSTFTPDTKDISKDTGRIVWGHWSFFPTTWLSSSDHAWFSAQSAVGLCREHNSQISNTDAFYSAASFYQCM